MTSEIFSRKPTVGQSEYTTIPVSELLQLIDDGVVNFYYQNRGAVGTSKSRVRKLADNLDIGLGFGQISLARGSDIFLTADAHHRIEALIRRHQEGRLSKEDLKRPVSVSISHEDDFIKKYSLVNDQRQHGASQKASNTDLLLGSIWAPLQQKYGLANNLNIGFMNILVSLQKHGPSGLSLQSYYEDRNTTEELANKVADEAFFSQETLKVFDIAVGFVALIMNLVKEKLVDLNGKPIPAVKTLCEKAGVPIMLLIGTLSPEINLMDCRPEALVQELSKNPTMLSEYAQYCSGRHDRVKAFKQQALFFDALTRRNRNSARGSYKKRPAAA